MDKALVSFKLLNNHPFFLSSVTAKFPEKVNNKSSINFGRIYLTFCYGHFTSTNFKGAMVPMPKVQLRPVSNYFHVSAAKGSKVVILGIAPSRWYAITRTSAHLFNDTNLNFYKVLSGNVLDPMYEQCRYVSDPVEIINIVDSYLEEYYEEWNKPCPLDEILDEVFQYQGAIKLEYLISAYPYAKSTLYNYFKKYVGHSPKFFIRLIQFNNIIREIENNGDKLSTLLRAYNFYDYAHFKRDFQIFTGVNPREYPNFKDGSMMEKIIKEIDYK